MSTAAPLDQQPSAEEVRAEARAWFEDLREVGVYVTDAEGLVASLDGFLRDGSGWWREPRRAAAVGRFRETFALTHPPALSAWAKFFNYNSAHYTDRP